MWKIQHLSVTQILREINFGEFASSKTAVYPIFRAVNVCSFCNFQAPKSAKIKKIPNLESLNVSDWQMLHFKNPQI